MIRFTGPMYGLRGGGKLGRGSDRGNAKHRVLLVHVNLLDTGLVVVSVHSVSTRVWVVVTVVTTRQHR